MSDYSVSAEWIKKNYCLKAVNNRRERLGLSPLKDSSYHCKKCGAYNNPFEYKDYRRILNNNICRDCEKVKYKPSF